MNKTSCPRILASMCMAVLSCTATVCAQGIFGLETMKEVPIMELPHRNVSKAGMAEHLAFQAYLDKMEGIGATEVLNCTGVMVLGFSVDGFAEKEDKVWEVRVLGMESTGYHRTLRAILWVHSDTGKVHYVCGPWEQGRSEMPEEAKTPVAE